MVTSCNGLMFRPASRSPCPWRNRRCRCEPLSLPFCLLRNFVQSAPCNQLITGRTSTGKYGQEFAYPGTMRSVTRLSGLAAGSVALRCRFISAASAVTDCPGRPGGTRGSTAMVPPRHPTATGGRRTGWAGSCSLVGTQRNNRCSRTRTTSLHHGHANYGCVSDVCCFTIEGNLLGVWPHLITGRCGCGGMEGRGSRARPE